MPQIVQQRKIGVELLLAIVISGSILDLRLWFEISLLKENGKYRNLIKKKDGENLQNYKNKINGQ